MPLVDTVERHLSGLTEQLRQAHDRLGRLDEIESGLRRLTEEVRFVREDTRTVASEAASAVAAKVSDSPDGAAVLGLKRGLAALEARQDGWNAAPAISTPPNANSSWTPFPWPLARRATAPIHRAPRPRPRRRPGGLR